MYPSQYKRYGIDTAIYTIDEFIEKFDEAIANNQKSVSEYIFETIEYHTEFETESEQLKEDNWIGRAWRCPNFIIRLEKLKGYANLCLIISPLAEQPAQTA